MYNIGIHANGLNNINSVNSVNHVNSANHVNSVNHVNSINHANCVNHVDSVSHVNSVNSVNSVNNVVSESSVERDATSISDGIFCVLSVKNVQIYQLVCKFQYFIHTGTLCNLHCKSVRDPEFCSVTASI